MSVDTCNSGKLLANPIIIINMGIEMLYILEQRLKVQKIKPDKCTKVLVDISKLIFSPEIMNVAFSPGPVQTVKQVRTLADKFVHASIMRLNKQSMDKLFELMIMGFKYQVLCAPKAQDLLQLTINHLTTWRASVVVDSVALQYIDSAIVRCNHLYSLLPVYEMILLKQSICDFFQDRLVRVSIFLEDKAQLSDGTLVLPLVVPTVPIDTIHRYDKSGTLLSSSINNKENITSSSLKKFISTSSITTSQLKPLDPSRTCTTGGNMYSLNRKRDSAAESVSEKSGAQVPMTSSVQLMAQMMGKSTSADDTHVSLLLDTFIPSIHSSISPHTQDVLDSDVIRLEGDIDIENSDSNSLLHGQSLNQNQNLPYYKQNLSANEQQFDQVYGSSAADVNSHMSNLMSRLGLDNVVSTSVVPGRGQSSSSSSNESKEDQKESENLLDLLDEYGI